MAESEAKEPYRIPIEEDFLAAAKLTDMLFESKGGPWTYYQRISIIEAHSVKNAAFTRPLLEAMSSQARLIEPVEIKNDAFISIDPRHRATHAFRAGMWTGGFISKYLHEEKNEDTALAYGNIHNFISSSLPYPVFTDQEQYEENGRHLVHIGDEGLKMVGYETREYIEKWGAELIDDETKRRLYALGAGAVLYASNGLYTLEYQERWANYAASYLSKEISQYLANQPSSEN